MSSTKLFKTGDLVVLKSGGPVMTIWYQDKHMTTGQVIGYKCQWFAGKKLESGNFKGDSLTAAPAPEKPGAKKP